MSSLLTTLRDFPLTQKVELLDRVSEPDRDMTYVKATLANDYTLYVRELYTPDGKFYSYHLQDRNNKFTLRYDNARHYKNIATAPHHKHIGSAKEVQPLDDPSLEAFLQETQLLLIGKKHSVL